MYTFRRIIFQNLFRNLRFWKLSSGCVKIRSKSKKLRNELNMTPNVHARETYFFYFERPSNRCEMSGIIFLEKYTYREYIEDLFLCRYKTRRIILSFPYYVRSYQMAITDFVSRIYPNFLNLVSFNSAPPLEELLPISKVLGQIMSVM